MIVKCNNKGYWEDDLTKGKTYDTIYENDSEYLIIMIVAIKIGIGKIGLKH